MIKDMVKGGVIEEVSSGVYRRTAI